VFVIVDTFRVRCLSLLQPKLLLIFLSLLAVAQAVVLAVAVAVQAVCDAQLQQQVVAVL
jgi:hypothetical protein